MSVKQFVVIMGDAARVVFKIDPQIDLALRGILLIYASWMLGNREGCVFRPSVCLLQLRLSISYRQIFNLVLYVLAPCSSCGWSSLVNQTLFRSAGCIIDLCVCECVRERERECVTLKTIGLQLFGF